MSCRFCVAAQPGFPGERHAARHAGERALASVQPRVGDETIASLICHVANETLETMRVAGSEEGVLMWQLATKITTTHITVQCIHILSLDSKPLWQIMV